MAMELRGLRTLRVILAATMASTAVHYTDNVLRVRLYPGAPGIPDTVARIVIVVAWLVLTAVGLIGYRRYTERRYWAARACLLVYSLTGLISLGHFLVGVPQVSWIWFVFIGTDTLTGLAMWIFVAW